jgi:hypothetical protein
METSHRHSSVSIPLSAFFALTFISQGVSSPAQTKSRFYGEKSAFIISEIDAAVTKEFQEAWRLSRNGSDGFEGLVLVYPTHDGSILARSQGKSSEQKEFTFGWTSNIIAVVHTHPNGVDPKPAGHDLQLADRFLIPVFTITQRGMYVYDPGIRKTSMVQDGLNWLDSSKWNHDRQVAQKKMIR